MATITVTLVMIVKNEAQIIERCLTSVRPFVDYVVISDTGSSDATPDIITSFIDRNQLKGKVFRNQWKNFGYNRSLSVANAWEWLDEQKISRETNYLLTIDADMVMKFLPEFTKEELLKAQEWMIEQRNGSLNYYNVRIFRADLPYRCLGVTHEYWGCDVQISKGRLETVYIDDRNDGGSKADKFTRDIALLTQGLIDEPKNSRYMFYLAQSYADLGNNAEALRYYAMRIQAGGWEEEIFVAHRRRGDILESEGRGAEALEEWLEAYNVVPERSETLYRIVHYYRLKGKNRLAMMFLEIALQIPYPEDCILFIEQSIYHYKLIEELSIIGYYVEDQKTMGLLATQYLLTFPGIPEESRNLALNNSLFYLPKLSVQSHTTLTFAIPEPYKSSSSAFVMKDGWMCGVVRSVNYSIGKDFMYHIRDPQEIVRTANYWVQFNGTEVASLTPLEYKSPPLRDVRIKGLEDLRIWEKPGSDHYYGAATSFEYGRHAHPSIVFLEIGEGTILNLKPLLYRDEECQKNWTFFTRDNRTFAIYSHYPLTILEIDPSFSSDARNPLKVIEKYPKYNLSNVRGSANPVRIGDMWVCLVHEVTTKGRRHYYHRFLRYDLEWNLIDIGVPFYFGNLFVEFCVSIIYNQETDILTIPYSTCDNTTELVEIKYADLKWLPHDLKTLLDDTF